MSSSQASSAFAADAPRYGSEPAAAYYALSDGNGSTGVDALLVGTSSLTGNVTLSAGTGITLTPTANAVTITASGAGIASVAGTANQITATTASGAVTLSLAPPVPGPSAGAYTNANITIDTLGRVTAAANGAGALSNVLYFDISGGPIDLPRGGTGPSSLALPTLTGLTVGRSYYLSLVLSITAGPGFAGYSPGSFLRFSFQNVPSANAVVPRIFPATDSSYDLAQLQSIHFPTIGAVMAGVTEGTRGFSINFSGIITAQGTALSIIALNSTTTDITGTLQLLAGVGGAVQSFVQLQQLN